MIPLFTVWEYVGPEVEYHGYWFRVFENTGGTVLAEAVSGSPMFIGGNLEFRRDFRFEHEQEGAR